MVSLGATKARFARDVLMMSAMAAREGTQRKGERACLEGGQVAIRLLFDGGRDSVTGLMSQHPRHLDLDLIY